MSTENSTVPRIYGYAGQILRVDLTKREINFEQPDETFLRKYIGGATLGIKTVYDEVSPEIGWSHPENRLFVGTGPLGGTRIGGSGTTAVVTRGALTNGMASSQANGYFGAYLKFSGFDAIVFKGAAPDWVYLYIHDGKAELRDAAHLKGKDTWETDRLIKEELGKKEKELSVMSIGPAGENLVKFACILTDLGHIASHNGVGAVMGSKKLKAIAVERGRNAVPLKNAQSLSELAKEILARAKADAANNMSLVEGTVGGVTGTLEIGILPVRNYSTSIFQITPDKLATYTSQNIRSKFKAKPSPCWACSSRHCHMMQITEGKYAGRIVEEPEYEGMAACSALVGVDDVTTTLVINNTADRLGFDINETGWTMAWVIECYEKGLLTKKDTDGLEMTWGNGEAIITMLHKIASRQGFGNVLAEGVMRAAKHVGGEASKLAIHTQKGTTPHTHDHRAVWNVLFDHCISNTGASESMPKAPWKSLGLSPMYNTFDPDAVSTVAAKIRGAMQFEDSAVVCDFQTNMELDLLSKAINAATGWDMDFQEAMTVGKRAVNMARAFNIRCGIGPELDAPSERYGSTPTDGRFVGRSIMPHLDKMLRNYYKCMGWDESTGKPLPLTLSNLGLDFVIPHLWP
jgi:aldehyde:ferredoxin oxidoreductase